MVSHASTGLNKVATDGLTEVLMKQVGPTGALSILGSAVAGSMGARHAAERLRDAGFSEEEISSEVSSAPKAALVGAAKGLLGYGAGAALGAGGYLGHSAATGSINIPTIMTMGNQLATYGNIGGGLGSLYGGYRAYQDERQKTRRLIDRENLRRQIISSSKP